MSSAGREAVDLAAKCGLFLDPWQEFVLDGMLGETAAGKWAAFEAALIVPRQNGKNAVLEALELAGLFLFGERTIVHSAHRFDTCTEHFLRIRELIEGNPDFTRKLARNGIVTANGKEAVKLSSGARLKFLARQRGGGRGFSGNRIVFDEAFDLPAKAMGSMIPALAAKSMYEDVQVVYASSAPHSDSEVLHGLRKRGRSGDGGAFYMAEWGNDEGTDEHDREAWYRANPGLGVRITEEFVERERRALSVAPGEFARERLGIPDPLPDDSTKLEVKLEAVLWALRATTSRPDGEITLAYDVSFDSEWSSIVIGAGDQSAPYVEQLEQKRGVGWLPDRIVELVQHHKPKRLACVGRGPAGAQVGPIMLALAMAKLDDVKLEQLGGETFRQACGAFFTDVKEGRLLWFAGSVDLDEAARDAAARTIGDAWEWDIRNATIPICALRAATVARALLPVERTKEPPRKVRVYSF